MEANESNIYRLGTEEANDVSLSFDQPSEGLVTEANESGLMSERSGRQSELSAASSTFRDTHVDQDEADSLMHS